MVGPEPGGSADRELPLLMPTRRRPAMWTCEVLLASLLAAAAGRTCHASRAAMPRAAVLTPRTKARAKPLSDLLSGTAPRGDGLGRLLLLLLSVLPVLLACEESCRRPNGGCLSALEANKGRQHLAGRAAIKGLLVQQWCLQSIPGAVGCSLRHNMIPAAG
jgi:hypothetical protein